VVTKYKLLMQLAGGLAVLAVLAGIAWWIVSPRIELQVQRAERAEADLAKEQELTKVQALGLEGQQREIDRAADIDRGLKLLQQTITQQGRRQDRAIEELKRNDQTILDYFALPVPADVGVLYARPDTTDPAAYRAHSDVRPGAVLPAGPGAADGD
jgi:LysB family phage lysis regulatory protein